MRLDLEKLEESGGRFSQVYEIGQLLFDDSDLRLTSPVEVRGRVRRRKGEAELIGELHTGVAISCGRCLKPVELPVDVNFDERFVEAVSWREEEQHELQPEDLNLSVFDGETIELDELVKEEILLALPGQILCREDCRGLCAVCGIDRNTATCNCETKPIDLRWGKLKDLRF